MNFIGLTGALFLLDEKVTGYMSGISIHLTITWSQHTQQDYINRDEKLHPLDHTVPEVLFYVILFYIWRISLFLSNIVWTLDLLWIFQKRFLLI